jgi:hypothetical protein
MDKKVNKQAIIDEYLLGCFTYRELAKKYKLSRATINEWVLDYQGILWWRIHFTIVLAGGTPAKAVRRSWCPHQPATI